MRIGDQGEHVRGLQVALERAGERLPRYGADSDFGRETQAALLHFAKARGIAWDPRDDVPEQLLDLLGCGELPDEVCSAIVCPAELNGVEVYDLRSEQTDPHPKSKRDRYGKTIVRAPAAIDSIVLHQTGVEFDPPRGRTERIDLARRALDVACHAMAFRAGFLVLPVEPLWYVHHASRLNTRSLGLEVDGNYPGLVGRKPMRGSPTALSEETVAAARAGVRLLLELGRAAGCEIKYIYAHRQCDSWRAADPGQGLWQRVVLEYAVPELGLETRPRETFSHPEGQRRHGYPVPVLWDPDGEGRYQPGR
ncbi:MAG TPA: N-acetylmuramoyl-L-alanine amidase [Enhygromyxa sp.]|nr:N-acetylmuramoyl-L-alanine amidase [Enhygromyxa sp.]